MGKLTELMEPKTPTGQVGAEPHHDLAIENTMAAWGGIPYTQLSIILVHLRYLAMVHQTHHWTAKGDPFYGDHQLFDRLYEKVVEEVDSIGERAVGMGSEQNVNLALQVIQLAELVRGSDVGQTVPAPNDLAKRSMEAERRFLKVIKDMYNSLREDGLNSLGTENLLQGIADTHEGHVYLLKQRCSSGALGF